MLCIFDINQSELGMFSQHIQCWSEAHGLLNLTVIKFMFCIVASSVAKAVDKIEIIVTPSDKFVPKQSSSYAFWWLAHGIVKALQAIYGIR